MAKSTRDNIVALFEHPKTVLPDLPLDGPPAATKGTRSKESREDIVDLAGKPKAVMAFGAGQTGKSTLLRWVGEQCAGRGVVLVTADAQRPTLARYFDDVSKPTSAQSVLGFIERVVTRAMRPPLMTVAIDFGADLTLSSLLLQVPSLHTLMDEAGVSPVAIYTLTPRVEDLTVLKTHEDAGFKPRATALVLNAGRMAGEDPEFEFSQIRRHAVYREAMERGAVEVWMPKLWAAKAVEDRRLQFRAAVASPDLYIFDRSRVHHWLEQMDEAFAPIATWLP